MKIWPAAWVAGALASIASTALAGNDDSILLGNDAAMSGGAVVATVNDGSALWYNPAGLARARNDSVDVGASAFALRKYNIPKLIEADDGTRADASFTEIVTIPSALTYVRRVSEHAVAGVALFASQFYDFTLRSSFDVDDRANDLRIRIQTVSSAEIARYHLAGGVGFALPRGFSVGLALFGDYGDAAQSSRESFDIASGGQVLGFLVNSVLLQQKVLGFHVRAGIGYRPTPAVSLGLSIESPAVYFYRNTRVTSIQSLTDLTAAGTIGDPQLAADSQDESHSQADFGFYAPVRARFGGAMQIDQALLSLEGDVQSRLKDGDVDVDREFVWNLRAGATMPVSDRVRLGVGLFTDRASDRKDAAGAGQVDFYGATLGGEYQSVRWLESEGPNKPRAPLTFSTTAALRYAYGFGKFPGTHLSMPDYGATDSATDIDVHELTLHIGSGLYF